MAKYGIPPQVKSGFELIISLNEKDIESLISILENSKIGEGIRTISEKVNQNTSLNEDSSSDVMRSIFSMVNIYVDSKDSVEQFSEDFINSYKFTLREPDSEKLLLLKNNIEKILPSFKAIKQTIKAKDLLVENANNFSEARIISDIRIVYDDGIEIQKKEQVALVIHNLRLSYRNNTGDIDKTFYLSLDLSDLSALKIIIDRALEKDNLIRTNHHELSFIDIK